MGQVTLLVKDNMPGQITLAIGDGANDVSMIQVVYAVYRMIKQGLDVCSMRPLDHARSLL